MMIQRKSIVLGIHNNKLPAIFYLFPILFFLCGISFGQEVSSEVSSIGLNIPQISSETASETKELGSLLDLEVQTYELTKTAIEMLLQRAQVLENTLRTEETGIHTEKIDPDAEKTFLENSLNEFSSSVEMKPQVNNRKLESAKLDLKILESRREIFFHRASDVEGEIRQVKERISRINDELKESKALEEKLNFRKEVLFGKAPEDASGSENVSKITETASDSASVKPENRKKLLLDELIRLRRSHIKTLESVLNLLSNRQSALAKEQENAKAVQKLFDDYLEKYKSAVKAFEDKVVRLNLEIQEERVKKQLQSVHDEQNSLAGKIETLDKDILESRTASPAVKISRLMLQREVFNFAKDKNSERIRYFELSLRQLKELVQLSEVKNRLSSEARIIGEDQKIFEDLKNLVGEFSRDFALSKKRTELLCKNRTLLEESLREFDTRSSEIKGNREKIDELKEEKQLKENQLEALDETIACLASQSAILGELLEKSTEAKDYYEATIQGEKERQLFARRILRFEKDFPKGFFLDLIEVPRRSIDAFSVSMKSLESLQIGEFIFGVFLLILLGLIIWNYPKTGKGETVEPLFRPAISAFFGTFFHWFSGEILFVTLFAIFLLTSFYLPHFSQFVQLPQYCVAARILFSLAWKVIDSLPLLADFGNPLKQGFKLVAIFLPVSVFLRQAGFYRDIVYFWELIFKIWFTFPIFKLVKERKQNISQLAELFKAKIHNLEWKIFAACFSLFNYLLVFSLLIALPGYNNLSILILKKGFMVLFLMTIFVTSSPIAEKIARIFFNPDSSEGRLFLISDRSAQVLYYIFRKMNVALLWILVVIGILHTAGFSFSAAFFGGLVEWIQNNGQAISQKLVRISIVLVGSGVILEFTKTIGESVVSYVSDQHNNSRSENERRVSTLVQIFHTTVKVVLFCVAGIMILRELDMDITPLLTGAGILGIAVGFGSQSLVKDFFSGFFILVENQFRVGDVIEIAGKSGTVEKINLKTTVLRGVDGSVFIIPNGEISAVKNMTFVWSRAVIDVGVSYDSDIDEVMSVLSEIGEDVWKNSSVAGKILEKPEVQGVEALGDSTVNLRLLVKTRPLEQWEVARVIRKRIFEVFKKKGICLPYPQRVITLEAGESMNGLFAGDRNKKPNSP
ncbi:MAG: mechanosensitive ion channel [Candidatus Riflebacteria bacterium]|nr:mechanosensitive ion channel [Candidatus Riflebacteria bacterium]